MPIGEEARKNKIDNNPQSNNITPIYGGDNGVNPVYGDTTMNYIPGSPKSFTSDYNYDLDKYDPRLDYNIQANMTREQQMENRGENQSGWEQMLRGIAGRTVSIVPKVLSAVGYVGGTIKAIFGGEWKDIWDNDFVKATDKMDKDLREGDFKVYGTHKYNSDSFWDKISTVKFWAEDGWDGLMYSAASMVQGYGLGLLGEGLGIAGKAVGTAIGEGLEDTKLLEAANNVKNWYNSTGKVASAIKNSINATKSVANSIGEIIPHFIKDNFHITAFNTIAEAGAEARSTMEDISQKIAAKTFNTDFDNLTESQKEYCKQQAAPYAKDVFLGNAIGLILPEAIQTSAFFGHVGHTAKSLADKIASGELKDIIAKSTAKDLAIKWGSEDWEERIQNAHQRIAKEHYDNNNRNTGLSGQAYDHLEAVTSFFKNFFTTEDRVAGFLGGITGLLGGVKGVINQHNEYNRGLKEKLIRDNLNKGTWNTFIPNSKVIHEQEEVTDKDGNKVKQDKLDSVTGKPILDMQKVYNLHAQHYNNVQNAVLFADRLINNDTAMAEEVRNLELGRLAYSYFANGYYGSVDEAHKDLLKDYEEKTKGIDNAPDKSIYDEQFKEKFEQFKQFYKDTQDNIKSIGKLDFNSKYYKNQQEAKDMLARDLFAQKVREFGINDALKELDNNPIYNEHKELKEEVKKKLKTEADDINIKLNKFNTSKSERTKLLNEYYNKEMTPYVEYESLQKEHDDLLTEIQSELSPEEKEHIKKYTDSITKNEEEGGFSDLLTTYNDFVKRKNDGEQIDDNKFQEVKDKLKTFGDINTKKNEILEAHKNLEKIALKKDILEQRLKEQRLIHGIDHRIYEDKKTGLYHIYPFYTPNSIKSNMENLNREKGEYEKFHYDNMLDFVHNNNIKQDRNNYDGSSNNTNINNILSHYAKKREFSDQDVEDIGSLKINVDTRIDNINKEIEDQYNKQLDEYIEKDESLLSYDNEGNIENTQLDNGDYLKDQYNNKESKDLVEKILKEKDNKLATLQLDKKANNEAYNKLMVSKGSYISTIDNRRQLNNDYSTPETAMKRILFDIAKISPNKALDLINDWSNKVEGITTKSKLTQQEKENLPPITEKDREDISKTIENLENDINVYKARLENPEDNISKYNKTDFEQTDYFNKASEYLKQLKNIAKLIEGTEDSRKSKQERALKSYLETSYSTITLLNNEGLLSDINKNLAIEYTNEKDGETKLIILYKIYEQLQKEGNNLVSVDNKTELEKINREDIENKWTTTQKDIKNSNTSNITDKWENGDTIIWLQEGKTKIGTFDKVRGLVINNDTKEPNGVFAIHHDNIESKVFNRTQYDKEYQQKRDELNKSKQQNT